MNERTIFYDDAVIENNELVARVVIARKET